MTRRRAVGEGNLDRGRIREDLKRLLSELRGGKASKEAVENARAFLKNVDATTLGLVEQELINEGVSHEEIRGSLCDVHLDIMKEDLVPKRASVAPGHPVHTFMAEHKVILETLEKVKTLVRGFKDARDFSEIRDRIPELKDAAHHLIEAESHHQREEEVLFPLLERHGIKEPPRVMKMDHVELRAKKKDLYELASAAEEYDFDDFRTRALDLGEYLATNLGSHIFKEDNILYQMALQVLSPEEWDEAKRECDRIGYCCFTPEDSLRSAEEGVSGAATAEPATAGAAHAAGSQGDRPAENVIELDLRPMPPFQRHERIFSIWDGLRPGQALKIINDHDPKPLHYQFEAEYSDGYEWQYEENGPVNWVVRLTRK